ncbi:MAG: bifunctional folylpolyglutamate synthase/dihydrofolate synthase [Blautia wexlerae]
MNYQESREYIDKITREIPSVLGLEHMRELMKRLGNPQDDLKYVHVAGTNGKGSVIAFLYSALSGARYRIGRYVSPTLYSYRGRMEVSGSRISREDFAAYITQVSDVIAAMTKDGYPHPTAFEIETAVAFLFFKKENCDLVLLEVGMGGNLDATNIIKNTLLAVLVSISMDHMSFLGNTLAQIAEKKAGIIKDGCRVVTARQKPEAMQVIERISREHGTKCTIADASEGRRCCKEELPSDRNANPVQG